MAQSIPGGAVISPPEAADGPFVMQGQGRRGRAVMLRPVFTVRPPEVLCFMQDSSSLLRDTLKRSRPANCLADEERWNASFVCVFWEPCSRIPAPRQSGGQLL